MDNKKKLQSFVNILTITKVFPNTEHNYCAETLKKNVFRIFYLVVCCAQRLKGLVTTVIDVNILDESQLHIKKGMDF